MRKVFLCGAAALMLAAPSAVIAASQIIKQADPVWCGNTTTDCGHGYHHDLDGSSVIPKPVEQFDETGLFHGFFRPHPRAD
jgi:hypothetical protein